MPRAGVDFYESLGNTVALRGLQARVGRGSQVRRRINACLAVLVLMLAGIGPLAAQESTRFEPAGGFGSFGFYTPSFPPNQNPPTGFNNPRGIAFRSAERLLIADYGSNKLQDCDLEGEDCFWIGNDGFIGRNSPGTFDRPHGVAVRSDGAFAVADEDNHAVQLCTSSGSCRYSGDSNTSSNEPSSALGRWAFPDDVAFDSEGRVYGLDTGNNRVQVLRGDNLNVEGTFMRSGTAPGRLDGARGIAVDGDDRIVIADTGNHRIQICDRSANCTVFGGQGGAPGQFRAPVGVEVDALGRIWVADTGNDRIQVCDDQGACEAFGADQGYDFDQPHDVAVHPSGRVAVVDAGTSRILLFRTQAAVRLNAGYSDAWFDPATAGQGFFFTVFPDRGELYVAHFTFDTERPPDDVSAVFGDPGHRWLTALGPITGATATLEVFLTAGGLLDATTPTPVTTPAYGIYEVEALGCDHIRLVYDLPAVSRQGTIELERVAKDNLSLCEALTAE